MTFFSRCDGSQRFESGIRSAPPRRLRTPAEGAGLFATLAGFAEDIGILVRYAVGLDYYGRDRVSTDR